jgi:hypothetical protein
MEPPPSSGLSATPAADSTSSCRFPSCLGVDLVAGPERPSLAGVEEAGWGQWPCLSDLVPSRASQAEGLRPQQLLTCQEDFIKGKVSA